MKNNEPYVYTLPVMHTGLNDDPTKESYVGSISKKRAKVLTVNISCSVTKRHQQCNSHLDQRHLKHVTSEPNN